MDESGRPARRPVSNLVKAVRALLVLMAVTGGLTLWRMHAEGHFFRYLKPNEWVMRWRGDYRYDAARHIVRQGAPNVPMVALTFDDGPHDTSPELLDILKVFDARATFFLVGTNVVLRPEVARRMGDEGHDLANHSRTHLRLPPLRRDQIRNEINNDTIVIARATGRRVRLFRPPGGQYDDRVTAEAAREGLMTVLWSINTGDWEAQSPRWIINRVLSDIQPGDIILLHEDQRQTLDALPEILRGLRRRGLQPVTVTELLEASNIPLPPLPSPPP
jgi:peptidoglycan/xylan/chitin deacetylase (PgdA/CDA1 family)